MQPNPKERTTPERRSRTPDRNTLRTAGPVGNSNPKPRRDTSKRRKDNDDQKRGLPQNLRTDPAAMLEVLQRGRLLFVLFFG